MIKDILVHVDPSRDGRSPGIAAEYALSLAARHEAHVRGHMAGLWAPLAAATFADVPASLIESQQREAEAQAFQARTVFEEAARLAGVSWESYVMTGDSALVADTFALGARVSDLTVVAQDEPESSGLKSLLIEAALFDSGRPVLIVPYVFRGGFQARRILVAWDHSRAAARALHDALPLIRKAEFVQTVTVERGGRGRRETEVPGADVAAHLARHGLTVDVHRIPGEDVTVADALLSYAADTGADLLVMGGYEHSRFRELLLGGATLGILQSATLPVLMSH